MDNTLKPCKQLMTSLDWLMVRMLFPLEIAEKASRAFKKKPNKINTLKLVQTLRESWSYCFCF